jgi:hypothetical protein
MPIFDVVFNYKARVVRGRDRLGKEDVFRAETSVDIRETTADEAPVAVRFSNAGDRKPTELRVYEDRLYRPFIPHRSFGWTDYDSLKYLRTSLASPHCIHDAFEIGEPHCGKIEPSSIESDSTIKRTTYDGRKWNIDKVAKLGVDLLLIDGRIWTASYEPVYQLKDGALKVVLMGARDPANHDTYRLDQEEMMRVETAAHVKDGDYPTVEFLSPATLRYQADEIALLRAADGFLSTIGWKKVPEYPREIFVELNAAKRVFYRALQEDVADGAAFSALLEAMTNAYGDMLEKHEADPAESREYVLAAKALERWRKSRETKFETDDGLAGLAP